MFKSTLAFAAFLVILLGMPASAHASNFVVTPEPVAFILYGLGGLPLAIHLLRRKETKLDKD